MRIFLPRIAYPDLPNDVNTLPSLKSFKSVTISNEETKFLLLDQTAAENEAEKI